MFNKNTFLQHTTNASNHNRITQAGIKAPFSLREQSFEFPTMYSGDERPDVPRTGMSGRKDIGGMIKMNPTTDKAIPYDEDYHAQAHNEAIMQGNSGEDVHRKHDPMGFHIDRAVKQWRTVGAKPGEPSMINLPDVAEEHFGRYVKDLISNGDHNQMYRPNMDKNSEFYRTHFKQFKQGMIKAHNEME